MPTKNEIGMIFLTQESANVCGALLAPFSCLLPWKIGKISLKDFSYQQQPLVSDFCPDQN